MKGEQIDTIKDFLRPEVIWFLIGLVLLIMESVLPGLIIAFFGVGAWIVALVCLITDIGINTQLIIFIVSSVLSLLFLRKWLKEVFIGHSVSKQDLNEFGKLAKTNNSIIIPSNLSDIAGMIKAAASVIKDRTEVKSTME